MTDPNVPSAASIPEAGLALFFEANPEPVFL
jgi:hypothetical protein